jgi:DNA-binding MarR family transcriptional regulator
VRRKQAPFVYALSNLGKSTRESHRAINTGLENLGLTLNTDQVIFLYAIFFDENNSLPQLDLKNMSGLPRTTVTSLVKHLELLGLVTKTRNTKNTRTTNVTLTAKGEDFMALWAVPIYSIFEETLSEVEITLTLWERKPLPKRKRREGRMSID